MFGINFVIVFVANFWIRFLEQGLLKSGTECASLRSRFWTQSMVTVLYYQHNWNTPICATRWTKKTGPKRPERGPHFATGNFHPLQIKHDLKDRFWRHFPGTKQGPQNPVSEPIFLCTMLPKKMPRRDPNIWCLKAVWILGMTMIQFETSDIQSNTLFQKSDSKTDHKNNNKMNPKPFVELSCPAKPSD